MSLVNAPAWRGGRTLAQKVAAILRKYGTDAHLYLPGIGVFNGFTAGNYLDSAGTTPATVDNPVGLVEDANGTINALQATTANKPILRRGAVNLLTYSEQFNNAIWAKAASTVTANTTVAPDGTTTADTLSTPINLARLTYNFTAIAGVYTASIYIKGTIGEKVRIELGSTLNFVQVTFDGTWQRVSVTATLSAGSSTFIIIRRADFGDTARTFFIWGAQLETGSVATDYVPTTTAPASNLVGGYHWVSDSTDLLTATYPAGYESATIVNALAAGQSTLTAQNIVGAYSIGPSVDTYGRFIFRTGLTASELTTIQTYANRLAGV